MNAQQEWKIGYDVWCNGDLETGSRMMNRYRREAALERKLEAAQRDNSAQFKALEANEELIGKLFQRVGELERELQERYEREKLRDKIEWGT